MNVTEKDRLELRRRLTEVIGEASTTVLMEALPPVDYDQLATKDDLAMTARELRAEMHQRFAEMHQRFADIDQQFARMDQRFAQVDGRFASAELSRARDLRLLVATHIGSMLGFAGLILGFG